MAAGDLIFFNKAITALLNGTHDLDTHEFKVAICDNTVTPVKTELSPAFTNYTEVGIAGSYITGGTVLVVSLVELNGITTLDFTNNPTWLLNVLNDVDAFWGIVYNNTNVGKEALAFIDLGGPFDMQIDTLTITWHPDGVFDMLGI